MKTKSPAAKLPVKGQVTKQTTVKGSFASYFMLKTFTHPNNGHVIYTMPQKKKKTVNQNTREPFYTQRYYTRPFHPVDCVGRRIVFNMM